MGRMSDLLKEYKTCTNGSQKEAEIVSELYKIVDWMKENGHLTKPFKLPRKGRRFFGAPFFPVLPDEDGLYCGRGFVYWK